MPEETKNDYFIASFIIAAVITAAVFGGCLYIRHIRGDNSYASMNNLHKTVKDKR